jgi:uncharacterized protein YjiS (DUF1127 family)
MREGHPIAPATGASALILAFPLVKEPEAAAPAQRPRGLVALLGLWRRRWLERREMRDLAIFEPDSVLADIGIDRKEAWRRARTPFWRP